MASGHVRMSDRWRALTPTPVGKKVAHLKVSLSRDGKQTTFLVHRLVLEAFVGPCPEGMEACHDPDPDPTNNRLDNLRWDTPKANGQDRIRHGSQARGEANGSSKLTRDIVAKILYLRRTEGLGGRAICRRLGIGTSLRNAADHVIYGKTWRHVAEDVA